MILVNTVYDTRPIVIHAQGKEEFCPMWASLAEAAARSSKPVCCDADLSIFTWNTGLVNDAIYKYGTKRLGCFEESCRRLGVKVDVVGGGVVGWTNRMKIPLTVEYLARCRSKYVMGCDSSDVILIGNPDLAVERLSCKLLFNAEILHWPQGHESLAFEDRTGLPPFRYLNAGAWIGEREYCLEFFRRCQESSLSIGRNPYSEQVCIKEVYPRMHPETQCDHKSCIFQTLNRVEPSMLRVIELKCA